MIRSRCARLQGLRSVVRIFHVRAYLSLSDDQKPLTNYQPPTTNYHLRNTHYHPPTTNHQLPTANHQLPTTLPKHPGCPRLQPFLRHVWSNLGLAIFWIILEHFSRTLWFSPESGATRPSNLFWRLPHCQPIFAPPTLPTYFGASHPSNLFWRTHPPNLFCRPPPSSLFCGLPRFQLPLAHPSGHSCQYLLIRVQH
jgi:hypothetical protein